MMTKQTNRLQEEEYQLANSYKIQISEYEEKLKSLEQRIQFEEKIQELERYSEINFLLTPTD